MRSHAEDAGAPAGTDTDNRALARPAGVSLRTAVADAITGVPVRDDDAFCERATTLAERRDLEGVAARVAETAPDRFTGPPALDDYAALDARARRLTWRLWVFDRIPLGLTLSGPAYRDTPLVYATRTFRDLTGYTLAQLRGENPRLLQGPETEAAAVADLREAIDNWNPVTVELRNYRADGTPFRNRVSLAPVAGPDGTVTHWVGVQAAVDDES